MNTICISSSLRFKETIKDAIQRAKDAGITALFPNLEYEIQEGSADFKAGQIQKVTFDHFQAIETAGALYVICPGGYIGQSVLLEIGYAVALKKIVCFSEELSDRVLMSCGQMIIPVSDISLFKNIL